MMIRVISFFLLNKSKSRDSAVSRDSIGNKNYSRVIQHQNGGEQMALNQTQLRNPQRGTYIIQVICLRPSLASSSAGRQLSGRLQTLQDYLQPAGALVPTYGPSYRGSE